MLALMPGAPAAASSALGNSDVDWHRPACCWHLAWALPVAWALRQPDTRPELPGWPWVPPCLLGPAGAWPLALPGGLGVAIGALRYEFPPKSIHKFDFS